MTFRDDKDQIDASQEAWDRAHVGVFEAYAKRGILLAAYHLWEDGFCQGDATDEEMEIDALSLGVDVSEEGWEDRLFELLDAEFLSIYAGGVA